MLNRFRWLDKGVDRLGYWVGGWGIMTTFFTWLSSQLVWMQPYGWAEFLLLGLLIASLIVLLACVVLVSWRFFRPPTKNQNLPSGEGAGKPFSEFAEGIVTLYQNQDRRLEIISADIKSVTDRLHEIEADLMLRPKGLFSGLPGPEPTTRLEAIEEDLHQETRARFEMADSLKGMIREATDLLGHHVQEINKNHAELVEQTRRIFRDKQNYRLLVELDSSVVRMSAILDTLAGASKDKPSIEQWTELFREWQHYVREFSKIAMEYGLIEQALWHTSPDEYKASAWSVTAADVGSEDALHDFKTYRLLQRNFEEHRKRVLNFVRAAAWVS